MRRRSPTFSRRRVTGFGSRTTTSPLLRTSSRRCTRQLRTRETSLCCSRATTSNRLTPEWSLRASRQMRLKAPRSGGLSMADYMGLKVRHIDTTESGGSSYVIHVAHAAEAIVAGKCNRHARRGTHDDDQHRRLRSGRDPDRPGSPRGVQAHGRRAAGADVRAGLARGALLKPSPRRASEAGLPQVFMAGPDGE